MGDLPEPKKQTRVQLNSPQERFMPQDLVARKDRRLSHMVGLDQVGHRSVVSLIFVVGTTASDIFKCPVSFRGCYGIKKRTHPR